jgi:adenine-specific DNA-methyltransferase
MSKKIDRQALLTAVESCTGLTESQRADLHQLLTETPKYGLVWEDTPEEVYEELKEEIPVMNEDRSKAIVNGNEYPNHVIIEGDNLHALTDLCYTHAGKIDVIYIDPPYNTGNKDFVYNDQFIDKENSYRHSKWLSFMERRLLLAKVLLSDRGVIFIQIDDNEQANLSLLCNEIFGEWNAIGPIIQNKLNAKNDTVNIQKNHEFILCFRKVIRYKDNNSTRILPNIVVKAFSEKEVYKDGQRFYYLNDSITTRGDGGTLNARPNLGYSFYYNPQTSDLIPLADYDVEKAKTSNDESLIYSSDQQLISKGYIFIRPPKVRGKLGCWTWDINKAKRDKDLLVVIKTKNRYNVVKRTFVNASDVVKRDDHYYYEKVNFSNSKSILEFSTNDGTTELRNVLGNNVNFNNPKNVELIKYLLLSSTKDDSLILDFFAGSGTTLHATMELNKEDGGRRQCILVTNNENQICEEVTYPRNKKVIEGYDTPKGEHVEGLHDNNLRYFKMDSVSRIPSMHNRRKLAAHMVDMLRIKHNIYTRKNQIGSYTIDTATMRYYEDNGRRLLVIMMPTEIYGVVEAIQALPPLDEKINVYVYSDGPYAYEDDFAAVADRVNVIALPGPMLKTFHRIAPEMNDVQVAEPDRELTEGEADDTSNDFNDGEE